MPRHETLTLPSPAKLNLFLHILGRREDGYHELQTVFQILDFGDQLSITRKDKDTVSITPAIPGLPMEENLIFKAASILKQATGCTLGAEIQLHKQLPMGGGIGGGSSNAATTLLGLNHIWDTNLTLNQLAELGRQLGADVPVFVQGRTAWAEGVGELLEPIDLEPKWYLVLAPDCHVSTQEIFSNKYLTRDNRPIKVAAFLERGGENNCQPLVEKLYPQVKEAVDWLTKFSPAMMTGTGACVFASFSSKREAEAVLAKCPTHIKGFIAKGVNQSPLHQHLSSIE